jgi:hypothetical protein
VVWWNVNERPEAARGLAAPTTGTSLTADLSVLNNNGAFPGGQFFWTVLIVREGPYIRLSSPADSEQRSAFYNSGAAQPPSPPTPPPPK